MKTMPKTRVPCRAEHAPDLSPDLLSVKTWLLGCAFLFCTAIAAQAATFTGTAQGAWTSVNGTFGYRTENATDPATVTWGVEWKSTVPETTTAIADYVAVTAPDSNRMTFAGNSAWSAPLGGLFSLGSLEYFNGTSYAVSHDFMGASLTIDVALTDPLVSAPLSFEYAFRILTTTNEWISVPADADTLYVQQAPMAQYFQSGNQRYLFEILGLSSDGGSTFSDEFIAYEPWQGGYLHAVDPARAEVYARITTVPVPLPASLPLLLSALAAAGYVARRKGRMV